MSGDKENGKFSDGLAEEIMRMLTRIPGLRVIARTSALRSRANTKMSVESPRRWTWGPCWKAASADPCSLSRAAQLLSAVDGSHVWSERYERSSPTCLPFRTTLPKPLPTHSRSHCRKQPGRAATPTLAAYDALLKGRHHMLEAFATVAGSVADVLRAGDGRGSGYSEPHANVGLSYFWPA
jgi:hypothetical protein